ncbi:eukaryotic translation initiation factor 4 gamma 3-like isoform X2 [Galleria mellonella]|uniref:Eukaryotic translation initiation factor 4 gamma 3-like isoform X2 n=1 Tax=Galleria mellonella TaxID=7137 RepID=A0ABM3MMR3_GALME|nr:eukaryotic translation initiation factor 4 gamma 3-like isoform X2 [Galleria mellonella]
MVALRGTNTSLNTLSHACVNHGNQTQQNAIDVAQSLQTSLNMPQSAVAQHINANQINLQPLNNVSLQFIPQNSNPSSLKHEQSSTRYSNSNCMLSSHHYRLLTQARPVDCFHSTGGAAAGYMQNAAGGAQTSGQAALRVQQTPQPSAPPAPQQDMSKTTMAGHSFVAPQNQTPQNRPQYNYQYRTAQHGTRPTSHQRQQQPFIAGATAPTTGPMMYNVHPIVFQPTHMGMQTYQPRSNSPGYFPYMHQYLGYSNPAASHTPPYYYPNPNGQPLQTANIQGNAPGGRTNPTTPLVGPQGTPATPAAQASSLPHPQAPTQFTQAMPGIRTTQMAPKRSHRVPIINPDTKQEIYVEENPSGDSSGRQTPQTDQQTHSAAEEFTRKVNEIINQPSAVECSNKLSKNNEIPITTTPSSQQVQSNITMTSINNNNLIKDIVLVNENKNLGLDVAIESNDTPVVSAISDSPVIVPKLQNNKQLQKNSDQSLVIDTSKNLIHNKQHKQNKSKPVVPQNEDLEKVSDVISDSQIVAMTVSNTPVITYTSAPVTSPESASPIVPPVIVPAPQPQRIRENRSRVKSEEKVKHVEPQETNDLPVSSKSNGPTTNVVISSVDSLQEVINSPTSQYNKTIAVDLNKKQTTPLLIPLDIETQAIEINVDKKNLSEPIETVPTATELLSASIEKVAKELPTAPETSESKEASSAIQAQAKLTQNPDSANGNGLKIDITKEDINKNEKIVKNSKNSNKKSAKMANSDTNLIESNPYQNGKDETDKVNNAKHEKSLLSPKEDELVSKPIEVSETLVTPSVFVPKYKYSEDQWSPINKSGKKCYNIGLLKQIKDDPLSKNKPNVPLLETCNIIKTSTIPETIAFSPITRPINDSLFPPFAKSSTIGTTRSNTPRDAKKDSRNLSLGGKGSMKSSTSQNSNSGAKIIHVVTLSREEVKLNEVDSAWKPSRFRKETLTEDAYKTQELYKKFRGILNKLTPQKFDTLLEKVKTLEINNQTRLEGVIDLVFEKAIDEPNFSEAYAAMCNKLSMLKVPADKASTPDQCVNFRALIISKCQNQFVTKKVDDQVLKLEKEIAECNDATKKKELQLILEEEYRRARMRSVGNVRFIGELYKLKMLTSKIMLFCMNHLIGDKLEEEKLECLCKLLTTIGEQVENEVKELDNVFKKMQDIINDRKNNKISSRVRFMIQDVIELRRRKWVGRSVVDSQPKMMDQIQKEAEQQQRQIELLNSTPVSSFRSRDEGSRGKRGEGRRQNSNSFQMDNSNIWKSTNRYTVDTSKFKAATTTRNLSSIKLAPPGWNHGSATKTSIHTSSNPMINLTKNMYSVLENNQADPVSLKGSKDTPPSYHTKGASIERSTFNSRGDFNSGSGSRSGSMGGIRSNSGSRSVSAVLPTPSVVTEISAPVSAAVPQEPLSENKKKTVHAMIDLSLMNPDDNELVVEVQRFETQYHAAVVTEILNMALEKTPKETAMISKSLLHLINTNTISPRNFEVGLTETLLYAPDLYIDIPMLYEYLGKFIAPQIEKKHITILQIFKLSESIIASKQGHLLLKAIIRDLKESMGPTFAKSKWQESGLQLRQWMHEDQISTWLTVNNFEFLEGATKYSEESKKIFTPNEIQKKLIQLMNSDENCDCIKGWARDNLGKSSNEDWFMRILIQSICEHALFGPEGRDTPHFNQERMNKYAGLINEFGDSKDAREASCLFGIQQLIHRLEHPQGLTLQIFQYLHEQYIITVEGFIAWEESEMEPEGKGVMMKALTSFFTNIKEADEGDSCSED